MRPHPHALAPLLMLVSCATVAPPPHPAPPGVEQYIDGIDWTHAGDEAVSVLSGYLKVDTSNPPGNETRGTQYLARFLEREGIASKVYEFAPGRGSLVARLPGRGKQKPLCLLSHVDVVTAEAQTWDVGHGPFSGTVDRYVWGRGALDIKGLGTLELLTLVWLKRVNVPLARDVVLIAVADEEVDGRGMRLMVEQHWNELGCSHVVNEGGIGVTDLLFPGQTVYPISVAEKGVLWLKVVAKGEAGHGSVPTPIRAPSRLLHALGDVLSVEPEPSLHASLYELMRSVGVNRGGVSGFVLQRPALARLFVTPKLMAQPPARAAITNTCQLSGLSGTGSSPNVVPSEASGILDCRVLPGTSPDQLLEQLKQRVHDPSGVTFEVLERRSPNESPADDPFFAALARRAVAGRSNVAAGPALSPGFTDSMYARTAGARAYGFVPFEVPAEDLNGMHGRNERVSVENVHRGLRALYSAVVDVAADLPRP